MCAKADDARKQEGGFVPVFRWFMEASSCPIVSFNLLAMNLMNRGSPSSTQPYARRRCSVRTGPWVGGHAEVDRMCDGCVTSVIILRRHFAQVSGAQFVTRVMQRSNASTVSRSYRVCWSHG